MWNGIIAYSATLNEEDIIDMKVDRQVFAVYRSMFSMLNL